MLILEVNYKNKSYLMHVNIHESRTQQILENIKKLIFILLLKRLITINFIALSV